MLKEFKNITSNAVVLSSNGDRVILVKRSKDSLFPNSFGLPGGKIRIGESIEDSLRRELNEEIGLEPEILSYLGIFEDSGIIMNTFLAVLKVDTLIPRKYWKDIGKFDELFLAPNTKEACEDAILKFKELKGKESLYKVDTSLAVAEAFVIDNLVNHEHEFGWDHYLEQPRIGIIGSALGILTLTERRLVSLENRGVLSKVAETLQSKENIEGGWCTKSIGVYSNIPIVESTCYCLLALGRLFGSNKSKFEASLSWLLKTQHYSGGWGTYLKSKIPRIMPTCLALSTLRFYDQVDTIQYKHGLTWLLEGQNKDGGWGVSTLDNKSTAAHTANVIITLIENGFSPNDRRIIVAINFLVNRFIQKNAWDDVSELEYIYNDKGDALRFEFKHPTFPLVLLALLMSSTSFDHNGILWHISELISSQTREGYWLHSLALGHVPIWNQYAYIKTLSYIKKNSMRFLAENTSDLTNSRKSLRFLDLLFKAGSQHQNIFDLKDTFRVDEKSLIREKIDQNINLVESLKKDLSMGKVDTVLNETMQFFRQEKDSEVLNQIILLSSNHTKIKLKIKLGTAESDEINREEAKIVSALLAIIDENINTQF